MRFKVLGSVRVVVADVSMPIKRAQRRAILGYLLLNTDRLVTSEELVDALWGEDPPKSAKSQIHAAISALRAALGPDGQRSILSETGGYRLAITADELDLLRFNNLVAQAQAEQDPERAARQVREALALWEGPPLSGITARFADPARAVLQERYLSAYEFLVDIELSRGHHVELVPELMTQVETHPLREKLTGQLMLALFRSGRQMEAFAAYDRIRALLVEELGCDPTSELRAVHRYILEGDGAETVVEPAQPVVAPLQLIAQPSVLIGRDKELGILASLASGKASGGNASTVVIIDGMPGVGKTALAVYAAHQLAPSYPDGHLFIDLYGFSQGVRPLEPATVLRRMLSALGVADSGIPQTLDERAALYRSRLSQRKMIIILDNAASEAQVVPLLSAAPGCLVLVTSRLNLAGLDDTVPLSLDALSHVHAAELLAILLGRAGTHQDHDGAVDEMVELCGRLPLALRVAAARFRHRPSWTLGYMVQRLRSKDGRLKELRAGERGVSGTIGLSYRYLSETQQGLFRSLGVASFTIYDEFAAAAAANVAPHQARSLLEELVDANLVTQPVAGRFQIHDLVHLVARAAVLERTAQERAGSRQRLADSYVRSVLNATAAYRFGRVPSYLDCDVHPGSARSFADPASAMAWLDVESDNVIALIEDCAKHGLAEQAWRLSAIIGRYFSYTQRFDEWRMSHGIGWDAALLLGPGATAVMKMDSGLAAQARWDFEHALAEYQAAQQFSREGNDELLFAYSCAYTSRMYSVLERVDLAERDLTRALAAPAYQAEKQEMAWTVLELATLHTRQDKHEKAEAEFLAAIRAAEDFGDQNLACFAHHNFAYSLHLRGWIERAVYHNRQEIEIARGIGYVVREARGWEQLGDVYENTGSYAEAAEAWRQSVRIFERLNDRRADDVRQKLSGLPV